MIFPLDTVCLKMLHFFLERCAFGCSVLGRFRFWIAYSWYLLFVFCGFVLCSYCWL